MRNRTSLVGALALGFMTALAVTPLQGQDVTYRFRSEMKTGGTMDKIMAFAGKIGGDEGQTRTEYLKGRQLRTDEGTQTSTIVRVDEKRMYFLHHDQKSYVSLSLDSLGAGVAAMAQGIQEAEMNPEADGGEEGPSVTFRVEVDRTGEKKDMAGYPAEQVFITLEGERVAEDTPAAGEEPASRLVLLMELWMSDEVPGYRELQALQEEYGSQIAPGESGEAMGEALLEMFTKTPGTREALERAGEEMMKLEGMAVRSDTYIVTVPPGEPFRRERVLDPPDEGGSRTEDVKKMAGNMLGGLFGGGKKEETPEEEAAEETPVQKTVLTLTEELVEVRTDPLPEDLFRVPGEYTETRGSGEAG